MVCVCPRSAIISACLWLWEVSKRKREREKKSRRKRKKERDGQLGRGGVDGGLSVFFVCLFSAAAVLCGVLTDNRKLLAYLCCTPHSCSCCLPLPAKSHPAATWGRRSAPPGPCSSSSGRGQITHTNHSLIPVIKETLITTELRSSASLNVCKHTIWETIHHET